jgi:hypothetical protein
MTELWWRDRYTDIEKKGYRLRPRYHPRWVYYTAGRGLATVVRVVALLIYPPSYLPAQVGRGNGRNSHTR